MIRFGGLNANTRSSQYVANSHPDLHLPEMDGWKSCRKMAGARSYITEAKSAGLELPELRVRVERLFALAPGGIS